MRGGSFGISEILPHLAVSLSSTASLVVAVVVGVENIKKGKVFFRVGKTLAHIASHLIDEHFDHSFGLLLSSIDVCLNNIPHDIRLCSSIVFRVVDNISLLVWAWINLFYLFNKTENIDGWLKLLSISWNILVFGICLNLVLDPRLDPIPITSILVGWRIHSLQILKDSS